MNKIGSQDKILKATQGKYDDHNALISIFAGAGGKDAQDWAKMLFRMYSRYLEKKGLKTKILDESYGEESGIKSITFKVSGEFAYRFLKNEKGVHRLVRLSPYSAKNLRHTSFAKIEVIPEIKTSPIKIEQSDLKIDFFRSSGPGGQNVNKVETGVRITHIPTGVFVSAQSERTQERNREIAFEFLYSKLNDRIEEEKEREEKKLKGEFVEAAWGRQMRSYVLHPYKMVKDQRLEVETSKVEEVLDGNLDILYDKAR